MTYTTTGSVTGDCGHQHRSLDAAHRCLINHGKDIKRQCGPQSYSDRSIVQGDGTELTPAEAEELAEVINDHYYE